MIIEIFLLFSYYTAKTIALLLDKNALPTPVAMKATHVDAADQLDNGEKWE